MSNQKIGFFMTFRIADNSPGIFTLPLPERREHPQSAITPSTAASPLIPSEGGNLYEGEAIVLTNNRKKRSREDASTSKKEMPLAKRAKTFTSHERAQKDLSRIIIDNHARSVLTRLKVKDEVIAEWGGVQQPAVSKWRTGATKTIAIQVAMAVNNRSGHNIFNLDLKASRGITIKPRVNEVRIQVTDKERKMLDKLLKRTKLETPTLAALAGDISTKNIIHNLRSSRISNVRWGTALKSVTEKVAARINQILGKRIFWKAPSPDDCGNERGAELTINPHERDALENAIKKYHRLSKKTLALLIGYGVTPNTIREWSYGNVQPIYEGQAKRIKQIFGEEIININAQTAPIETDTRQVTPVQDWDIFAIPPPRGELPIRGEEPSTGNEEEQQPLNHQIETFNGDEGKTEHFLELSDKEDFFNFEPF
jgi:hypothetical protein